jgi:hypothetical protein
MMDAIRTTDTVAIQVDEDGKFVVASWGEWEPTCDLRRVRPRRTTTQPDRLQQRFWRNGYSTAGHICDGQSEWRDVPLEII